MVTDTTGASVRQFVRHETRRAARLEVHPEHAQQFRLNYSGAALDVAVVDISRGGLGLRCGFFIPRNMRLSVHVDARGDTGNGASRTLKIRVIARRCTMVDHKPTYLVGLQYQDAAGLDEQELVRLIQASDAADQKQQSGESSEDRNLR